MKRPAAAAASTSTPPEKKAKAEPTPKAKAKAKAKSTSKAATKPITDEDEGEEEEEDCPDEEEEDWAEEEEEEAEEADGEEGDAAPEEEPEEGGGDGAEEPEQGAEEEDEEEKEQEEEEEEEEDPVKEFWVHATFKKFGNVYKLKTRRRESESISVIDISPLAKRLTYVQLVQLQDNTMEDKYEKLGTASAREASMYVTRKLFDVICQKKITVKKAAFEERNVQIEALLAAAGSWIGGAGWEEGRAATPYGRSKQLEMRRRRRRRRRNEEEAR
eukprot:7423085-Pyramimonas_sp.AAC.1